MCKFFLTDRPLCHLRSQPGTLLFFFLTYSVQSTTKEASLLLSSATKQEVWKEARERERADGEKMGRFDLFPPFPFHPRTGLFSVTADKGRPSFVGRVLTSDGDGTIIFSISAVAPLTDGRGNKICDCQAVTFQVRQDRPWLVYRE